VTLTAINNVRRQAGRRGYRRNS